MCLSECNFDKSIGSLNCNTWTNFNLYPSLESRTTKSLSFLTREYAKRNEWVVAMVQKYANVLTGIAEREEQDPGRAKMFCSAESRCPAKKSNKNKKQKQKQNKTENSLSFLDVSGADLCLCFAYFIKFADTCFFLFCNHGGRVVSTSDFYRKGRWFEPWSRRSVASLDKKLCTFSVST